LCLCFHTALFKLSWSPTLQLLFQLWGFCTFLLPMLLVSIENRETSQLVRQFSNIWTNLFFDSFITHIFLFYLLRSKETGWSLLKNEVTIGNFNSYGRESVQNWLRALVFQSIFDDRWSFRQSQQHMQTWLYLGFLSFCTLLFFVFSGSVKLAVTTCLSNNAVWLSVIMELWVAAPNLLALPHRSHTCTMHTSSRNAWKAAGLTPSRWYGASLMHINENVLDSVWNRTLYRFISCDVFYEYVCGCVCVCDKWDRNGSELEKVRRFSFTAEEI
jgi:hypothetical protein